MINFKPVTIYDKQIYEKYLIDGKERGCEFSFVNLYLWGRQNAAIVHDHLVLFSQFNQRSVYPFPVGEGDKKAVLDAVIQDAKERGIPCRITGIRPEQKGILENLYPDKFRFHCERGSFDYVYDICDLAELKGRKYQSKRNHCNRFYANYPDYSVQPLNDDNIHLAKDMADRWYSDKLAENLEADYHMERKALEKAFRDYKQLGMDGLILLVNEEVVAFTMGNMMSDTTFDVNFEKAYADVQGAYSVINREFATYLHNKYPDIIYLDREEDMGLEGLRKAKESYYPHHMIDKCWACMLEDEYEY
ncbi:MAG: DUF2156 domain-containing protein [Clostridia bacterium]|nr:DUF2156 domain-containing protein [Clostridia bacterium]